MNDSMVEQFRRDGYIAILGFYDPQDIADIQAGVQRIVRLLARKYGVDANTETPEAAMTSGYLALIAKNRAWGGEVYDAVKQIPSFMALAASRRNVELFETLRPGSAAGVAAGGYGIRIDNPREEKFRAPWHQEFPAQLRSIDGLVYWSPLIQVTPEMGPVEIAEGSHVEGPVPVYDDDGGIGKSGAYSLRLDREQERLAQYKKIAPLSKPGDLLIMDFLTLHQSGLNVSDRPRWSMQFRYFNFNDPVGLVISWKGSYAAGVKFSDLLPNLRTSHS